MIFADSPANILVVAAHPDDEVLGCGGTIARHADRGDHVDLLFLTDGVGARGESPVATVGARQEAAHAAAGILGAQTPQFLDFPDNRLDSVDLLDVIQAIEAVLAARPYDTVYTHWEGDLNIDHRVASRAVRTATRPVPGQSVRAVLSFEVPSSSEWAFSDVVPESPNFAVSIADQIDRKLAALDAYAMEMHDPPHPRSQEAVRALATWRGAQHGFAFAEAFTLVRAAHA